MRFRKQKSTAAQPDAAARVSLWLSLATIAASLIAAVISSIATYYWFDPATKEVSERGRLLKVDVEHTFNYYYETVPVAKELPADMTFRATLANVGKRPLKQVQVYAGYPANSVIEAAVEVDGYVVERVLNRSQYSVFALSAAVPPDAQFTLRFRGPPESEVSIVTERGDRVELGNVAPKDAARVPERVLRNSSEPAR